MPEQYFNVVNYHTYQMANQVKNDMKKDNNQQKMTRRKNCSMKYPTRIQRIDEATEVLHKSLKFNRIKFHFLNFNFIITVSPSIHHQSVSCMYPLTRTHAPWKTRDNYFGVQLISSVLGILVSYTNTIWIHYPAFGYYAF